MIPTIGGVISQSELNSKFNMILPYEHLSQDLSPLILSSYTGKVYSINK